MPFSFVPGTLPGVVRVTPEVFEDHRGFFLEAYNAREFHEAGITAEFVQDNHSYSTRGVVRGLHYQLNPAAQGKLVRVVQGEVFDVAVDLRQGSPSFGRWEACRLSAENREMFWIPPGFAHGFQIVSSEAHVLYKTSALYAPECDRGICWDDPEIAIDWPLADAILSEKDRRQPSLSDAELNFIFEK